MSKEFVQLSIWDLLEEAKQEPLEVDWKFLLDSLDVSLVDLEVSQQLQVAAEALLQMAEVFHIRSIEAFEELEVYRSSDGVVMGDKDFAPFVRQFMEIDFDEFIEPLVSNLRKPYTHDAENSQSIVEIIDKQVVLDSLDEMEETSLVEEAASIIELAYHEDIPGWTKAIADYFTTTEVKTATWSELCQQLNITPVEIWLGLLLGDFTLSQVQSESACFYEGEILVEPCPL